MAEASSANGGAAAEGFEAGLVGRAFAWAIDYGVLLACEVALAAVVIWGSFGSGTDGVLREWSVHFEAGDGAALGAPLLRWVGIGVAVQLGAEALYFTVSELASGGRSLGKALLGLRVVAGAGDRVGLRASALRNALRVVDWIPLGYALGALSVLFAPGHRRLGDFAAGTRVVRARAADSARRRAAEGDAWAQSAAPSSRAFALRAEERELLGDDELRLIRETLRRTDALPPGEAEPLLARSARALAQRLGRPAVAASERRAFLSALLQGAAEPPGSGEAPPAKGPAGSAGASTGRTGAGPGPAD